MQFIRHLRAHLGRHRLHSRVRAPPLPLPSIRPCLLPAALFAVHARSESTRHSTTPPSTGILNLTALNDVQVCCVELRRCRHQRARGVAPDLACPPPLLLHLLPSLGALLRCAGLLLPPSTTPRALLCTPCFSRMSTHSGSVNGCCRVSSSCRVSPSWRVSSR
eukprot:3355424-Rhodomonas_salina.1